MASAETDYYCHKCKIHIGHVTNFECPHCRESFIEEVLPEQPSSRSRHAGQSRSGGRMQFHGSSPFGNTTVYFGGNQPTNNGVHENENAEIGTFFQTVLAQLAGGLMGGGAQSPFMTHNVGGAGLLDSINLDTFLTQFLNQMAENGGPAPASENRIISIPTVKVTAEQAHDSLQCAICMDDFHENDEAKRLPCSHHFHEDCISRWLRMHGTCPTCRVTLDGDNTSNREYYNLFANEDPSSTRSNYNSNNRRNDGGNNGSSSGAGSTLLDFD